MFQTICFTFIATIFLLSCAGDKQREPLPQIDDGLKEELSEYLIQHYQSPGDYIVSKFKDHDIVFVGEYHRIKQNVELIQNIIPRLYENGVYNLGMEFACYADQQKIDSLITAQVYNEAVAREILFNNFVFWGYQEYADIFRAAWRLNRQLPEGPRRFRVVGLNATADWSHVKTEEDRDNPAVMKKVWSNGYSDEIMGKTVLKEFVEKGEKALIFSGSHHAFTEYKQPIYDEENKKFVRFVEDRMGNLVYNVIGKRAITIFLHSPWVNENGYSKPYVYPVDGVIDALMPTLGPQYRCVGFDTKGGPFGSLQGTTTLYKYGYDNFVLGNFCDGYIYQCPLSEYEGVTPIDGFVNMGNIAKAKAQSPNPWFKRPSVMLDDFNRAIAWDADIRRRFRRFH
ncbi:MAG: ChaN family lipoprotein [bacterium]